jgi:hypothetical protein
MRRIWPLLALLCAGCLRDYVVPVAAIDIANIATTRERRRIALPARDARGHARWLRASTLVSEGPPERGEVRVRARKIHPVTIVGLGTIVTGAALLTTGLVLNSTQGSSAYPANVITIGMGGADLLVGTLLALGGLGGHGEQVRAGDRDLRYLR